MPMKEIIKSTSKANIANMDDEPEVAQSAASSEVPPPPVPVAPRPQRRRRASVVEAPGAQQQQHPESDPTTASDAPDSQKRGARFAPDAQDSAPDIGPGSDRDLIDAHAHAQSGAPAGEQIIDQPSEKPIVKVVKSHQWPQVAQR